MKHLLRMLLFGFARAGLFFSVTGFVIGQWWMVSAQGPVRSIHVQVRVSRSGWSLLTGKSSPWFNNSVTAHLTATTDTPDWRFADEGYDTFWYHTRVLAPGVIQGKPRNTLAFSLAFRHWLTLTYFTLLYGALQLAYPRSLSRLSDS